MYAYGALRALASWRPARFEVELDPPGERLSFTAYTVGACNSKTYGGGMRAAPDAMLDDGLLEVVVLESVSKLAFLTKILPKVFKGTHVELPSVHVFRAAEVEISADRPFTMYADGDPIGELPVRVRAVRGAVSVLVPTGVSTQDSAFSSPPSPLRRRLMSPRRPPSRHRPRQIADGRAARTQARAGAGRRRGLAPARRRRVQRAREGPDAPGPRRDRRARRAPAAGQRARLGDERQDHDARAMLAAILERAGVSLVNNQSGANMAGGIASTLLAAARPGGRIAGELGLFEVDELWLDSLAAQLHPRAILLGNLFRDQLDRYGELETIADRWAAAVDRMPTAPGP